MTRARRLTAAACCLALAACSTDIPKVAAKWVQPGEREAVDVTFARAGAQDWSAIEDSFHHSVTNRGSDEVWSQIGETLKDADLVDRDLIGVNVNVVNGQRSVGLTYEGRAGDHWYVATVRLLDGRLYGFNVARSERSLVSANAFSVLDMGLPHLLMFMLGLGSIAVACVASYRALNSQIARRKLWAVLSFIMVGSFTLNWTTGQIGLQLLKLQLPPITFLKAGPAAPWIFGFGLPIFALIALRKVNRAEANALADPPADAPDAGAPMRGVEDGD